MPPSFVAPGLMVAALALTAPLAAEQGTWIRLTSSRDLPHATAVFSYRNRDPRPAAADPIFDGLAKPGEALTGGLVRARGGNKGTLSFAALGADGSELGYYELDAELKLRRRDDPAAHEFTDAFSAYWIRFRSNQACTASATLGYE